ncbi:MAG: FeoB small GTPase domain-containing protein [Butyricicoccus pullicaecorum]
MGMKIALAGNPNCGKTTLFNALTGASQHVGNWPGVTVEKKEGKLRGHGDVIIQDLPGVYSLSPYTLEEVVTRDYLVTEQPDAILNIIDASNLERNLYLTTQLMELGLPVVIALNMMDWYAVRAVPSSRARCRRHCVPVIEISALRAETASSRAGSCACGEEPSGSKAGHLRQGHRTRTGADRHAGAATVSRRITAGTPSSCSSATHAPNCRRPDGKGHH